MVMRRTTCSACRVELAVVEYAYALPIACRVAVQMSFQLEDNDLVPSGRIMCLRALQPKTGSSLVMTTSVLSQATEIMVGPI